MRFVRLSSSSSPLWNLVKWSSIKIKFIINKRMKLGLRSFFPSIFCVSWERQVIMEVWRLAVEAEQSAWMVSTEEVEWCWTWGKRWMEVCMYWGRCLKEWSDSLCNSSLHVAAVCWGQTCLKQSPCRGVLRKWLSWGNILRQWGKENRAGRDS